MYANIFKEITLEGTARIEQCRAANGSGMHLTGTEERLFPGWGMLRANGGTVSGDVVLGDRVGYPCTVRGTGKTAFTGTVTVEPGSTIELPVLLLVDGDKVTADAKSLASAKVVAEKVEDLRGPKIVIQKYKNKTGYKKRQGFRAELTTVKITAINA